RSLTRGIGELLRLLDPGLSDLVRTPQSEHLLAMLAEAVQARRRTRRKYTHAVQSELGQPVI
ncbi:hypothetical protein, partial [Aeromonas caviae]